jgi:simple sugar transport system substrate-binding protein
MNKNKKIAALAAVSAALCMSAMVANAEEDLITVGYAQVGHESDWRTANTQNYQDVFSEENGYELSLVDCDNDNAAQLEAVRNFITQELDYIVIAPIQSAGWDTVLQEAQDAGIPVIIADREIEADASLYDAWVGTNTTNEGITAGNWLAEQLDGAEANILVIEGSVGASATLGRTDGFNQVAADHDEWTIIDSQSGDFTQDGGQAVMESFIKSYEGQFNVVICQNDNEAYGAMDAMDAAGITYGVDGDVILISYDATHDGLQYTLDGKFNLDVECNPIQAEVVKGVIEQMEAGEDFEATTLVNDEAFCAGGTESEYATTMTQEVLDGRAY